MPRCSRRSGASGSAIVATSVKHNGTSTGVPDPPRLLTDGSHAMALGPPALADRRKPCPWLCRSRRNASSATTSCNLIFCSPAVRAIAAFRGFPPRSREVELSRGQIDADDIRLAYVQHSFPS